MKSNSGNCLDLIGQRFGRLVVIDRDEDYISPKDGKHRTKWLCDCDCGTKGFSAIGSLLKKGSVKSCGCLHRETSSQNLKNNHFKYYNEYNLTGEYGIGFTRKGNEFYFDLEDYEKIKNICWCNDDEGYVVGTIIGEKRQIKLHRLIMEEQLKSGCIVDHIHADHKNDNRKQNLRVILPKENIYNRRRPKSNKSGKAGVVFRPKKNKWEASIKFHGKYYYLGLYINKEDAIQARLDAEKKFFGEYQYIGEYA